MQYALFDSTNSLYSVAVPVARGPELQAETLKARGELGAILRGGPSISQPLFQLDQIISALFGYLCAIVIAFDILLAFQCSDSALHLASVGILLAVVPTQFARNLSERYAGVVLNKTEDGHEVCAKGFGYFLLLSLGRGLCEYRPDLMAVAILQPFGSRAL